MKTINILIIDDHKIVREGIRGMLESHKNRYSFIVDEADGGKEALSKIQKEAYNLILMDYQLPKLKGPELTKMICKKKPDAKILALSNYDELPYITNIIKAGAKGYILKNISCSELIKAIETVINDQYYYSNEVAVKLIRYQNEIIKKNKIKIPDKSKKNKNPENVSALSGRQLEILKLIAQQYTNNEISKILGLSKRTVDGHRQNILEKLNLRNTAGAIKHAHEMGLI